MVAGLSPWLARVFKAGAFVCVCGLLLTASASASSWVSMSVDEMISRADVVVHGRVISKTARWLERAGPSRIVTFYEIEAVDLLKGKLTSAEQKDQRIRIGVLGGEVGEYGQYVHGSPVLHEGESIVAFLGTPGGPQGARGVVGFNQGVLRTQPSSGMDSSSLRIFPLEPAFETEGRLPMRKIDLTLGELSRRCRQQEAKP